MNKHLWQSKYRVKSNWQTNYRVPHSGSRWGGVWKHREKEASALRSPTLHFINSEKQRNSCNTGNNITISLSARSQRKQRSEHRASPCRRTRWVFGSVALALNLITSEHFGPTIQPLSEKSKTPPNLWFHIWRRAVKAVSSLDLVSRSQAPLVWWMWGELAVTKARKREYREAFTSVWRHIENVTAAS